MYSLKMMKETRKMDMHSFLVKMLLPIYVVISLSLVISHAKAIEHPRRNARSKFNRQHIHVTVRPKEIDLYPGEVITIACKAKGGTKIEETPYISFYREIRLLRDMEDRETQEVGHIPLSSGDPGILIEPDIATDNVNEHRVKKLLTLGKFAWYTLEANKNTFYCKATDMDGNSKKTFFTVIKKSHSPSFNSFQKRKRRYSHSRRLRSQTRQQPEPTS